MKKNLELTYKGNDVKLNKKNYLIIIIPIILVVLLTIGIALFVFITNNNSNKLKNYLSEVGYKCNKKICTKQIDNANYTFNYKDIVLYIENDDYRLTLSDSTPALEIKKDEYVCTYTKADYTTFTLVDDNFIYEKKCEDYIKEVNNYIEEYKSIVNSSGIDVNKIKK